MTPKKIMEKAIETYGVEQQIDVAIEEMSELIKALLKDRRRSIKKLTEGEYALAKNNVIEEIADVEIMIEQLKMIYNCHNSADVIKNYKLNRLKGRLEVDVNDITGSN